MSDRRDAFPTGAPPPEPPRADAAPAALPLLGGAAGSRFDATPACDPSRPAASLAPAYFDALYARNPDPWGFETKPYERDKYAATLAALPRPRYGDALEVGCSIGVLTHALAPCCDQLLCLDAADAALKRARARNADHAGVKFRRARVPEEWPDGAFDLILLSEVLYYFARDDLSRVAHRVLGSLRPGGDAVLVHWLPYTDRDYPLTGDEAVTHFLSVAGDALRPLAATRTDLYRLDVLRRSG